MGTERFYPVIPFVIDGDGYSDRDRAMFVAGYEFCQVATMLADHPGEPISRPIHSENEDRIRVLCNREKRTVRFEKINECWSHLEIEEGAAA